MDRIRQFEVFIQIVENGSFTRAAEALDLPRSTVSTVLQGLEDSLGTQLLYRTTRSVQPTPEGLRFLGTARELVETMNRAENQFRSHRNELAGRLRIDMPSRMARNLVIPHLDEFFALYPDIELDLSATDRLIDLISEGVDGVVRLAELKDSELICRKIGNVPVLTCASAGYVASRGMPANPDDLRGHLLVNFSHEMPARTAEWEGTGPDGPVTVAMKSYLCVDNAECYAAAALAGHGIIQVPVNSVLHHVRAGRLVELLAEYRPEPMELFILYPSRRNITPRFRVFMDWFASLLKREGFVT